MKPLRSFVKELNHLKAIPFSERGWGNGYVIIPEDHPMHGKHYDDIDVDVHGGLTFDGLVDMNGMIICDTFSGDKSVMHWDEVTKEDAGGWIVGFDTAHYGDSISRWPQEAVQKEADDLKEQLEAMWPEPEESFDENAPNRED